MTTVDPPLDAPLDPPADAVPNEASTERFMLRLYVAGQTPKSVRAIENLTLLCEEHLAGRYHIEVIDLLENPQLARGHGIVAVPTLMRALPEPVRRIIGDLSDAEQVLVGLQLRAVGPSP